MTRALTPLTLLVAGLAACTTTPSPLISLKMPRDAASQGDQASSTASEATVPTGLRATQAPVLLLPRNAPSATTPVQASPSPDDNEEVSIAIEQTPLPMFVQILYGNVLKRPYSLDPAISARTEPVTFKSSRPLSKRRMNEIAVGLLKSYQLNIEDLGGVVRITPLQQGPINSTQLTTGKRMGEGVASFAAIHQYVELDYVRNGEVTQWLRQIMGQRIQVQEDNARNALLLSGSASEVRAALGIIESFDQPRMRGRIAARLTPSYASPTDLAQKLTEMLIAQGIGAATTAGTGQSTVLLLPVPSVSSVFVFATTQALLEHTLRWAAELDKAPSGGANVRSGLFTYAVKYADAKGLALTLSEVLGGSGAAAPATTPGQSGAQATARSSFGRVTVNNATNTLIIRGTSADEQQQLIDLLRELDRPTKSAWIEVVVAEVTTDAKEELGVSWTANNQSAVGASGLRSGTLNGSGLSLGLVNDARSVIANLSLLSSKGKGRVLSNPRVLARNGESATISVGREVPVVTSVQSTGQASSGGLFGNNQLGVLQQIQYRSTGVILQVRPVINSGNRMDLDISQEVSSAETTTTGVSSSPTISNRRIETKLSLRDGSTVLLGGLILRNGKVSADGLPLLKDLPLVGGLFGKRSDTSEETELLIMITPHVVNDDYEAEEVAAAVRNSFGSWAEGLPMSRVATERSPTVPLSAAPPQAPAAQLLQPLQQPALSLPQAGGATTSEPAGTQDGTQDGIVTSRPLNHVVSAPAASMPEQAVKPEAAKAGDAKPNAPKAASKPADSKTVTLPGGAQGKVVTDPKVLEEIRKAIGK